MCRRMVAISLCAALSLLSAAHARTKRASGASARAPAQRAISPTRVDPRKALAAKVRISSGKTTFRAALQRCANLTRVTFAVDWRALKVTGVTGERGIALKAREATAGQFLDLVLVAAARDSVPLAWYIEKNVVIVTTQRLALKRRRSTAALASIPPARSIRAIDFDRTELAEVVEFFRGLTGLNFHVNWGALQEVGVTKDTLVTMKLRNARTDMVLDMLTEQLAEAGDKFRRVYWVVDKGVVEISTGIALNGRLRTETYDLGDLVVSRRGVQRAFGVSSSTSGRDGGGSRSTGRRGRSGRSGRSGNRGGDRTYSRSGRTDRTGTDFSLRNPRERDRDTGSSHGAGTRSQLGGYLIAIVKGSIGEDMWQPIGKGSVRIIRNQLVVSQTRLGFKLLSDSLRQR